MKFVVSLLYLHEYESNVSVCVMRVAFTCFVLITPSYSAQSQPSLQLVYSNDLSTRSDISGWVMEGPGQTVFRDGWMEMYSINEEWHHVLWCPEIFPESFTAEWELQNINPKAGLLIVFFASTGINGEDIFDASLPPRDGTFRYYTKDRLRNYHISYYANNPKNPDREFAHLRKNPGFALVETGSEGVSKHSTSIHKARLVKDGGHITFFVDGHKVIDWFDDGSTFGPVHGAGRIGFRQMQWSRFRYRNFSIWKHEDPSIHHK